MKNVSYFVNDRKKKKYIYILEQRIGFGQQIQVKAKLVGYKDENKLVF